MSFGRHQPDWEFEDEPLWELEDPQPVARPAGAGNEARVSDESGKLDSRESTGSDHLPPGHYGYDDAHVVTVIVDDNGAVRVVDLSHSWRNSIDPRSLGSKLVEAARNAELSRVQVRIRDFSHQDTDSDAYDVDQVVQNLGVDTVAEWGQPQLDASSVLNLLDRLDNELGVLEQRLENPERFTIARHGPRGYISVTLDRNHVSHVEVHEHWIHRADNREIADEALGAFAAAQAAAAEDANSLNDDQSAIAELRALTSDPGNLLRQLGLSGPER